MYHKRFVIADILGFGWKVMARNFWFFVGLGVVAVILQTASAVIETIIRRLELHELPAALLILLINIVGFFISMVIGIGLVRIALSFCDARKPPFGTLFDYHGYFWRYVGTIILQFLIVLGGLLLFIVPGIIWSIKFSMAPYFVIDKRLGPIQALKASGRTTMGVKGQLFGFGILCTLIILLGYMALFVGVLAAYPIVLIANALVYRHLIVQTPELAEFGLGPAPPAPPAPQPVLQNTTIFQQPPEQVV